MVANKYGWSRVTRECKNAKIYGDDIHIDFAYLLIKPVVKSLTKCSNVQLSFWKKKEVLSLVKPNNFVKVQQ